MRSLDQPGLRSIRPSSGRSPSQKSAPRPKAPDTGGVTFHFSVTSAQKGRTILSSLSGIHPKGPASSHQAYTERPGAAEEIQLEQTASAASQSYIERDNAQETASKTISSFGNIGATHEHRIDFWDRLEKIERQPKTHKIQIDPDTSPDFWLTVNGKHLAGEFIPTAILKAHLTRQKITVTLDTNDTLSLISFIHKTVDHTDAVTIVPGRGARIQTRIVAELPHELSAAQRLAIAKAYCQKFEDEGHPYWAVIHAPDRNNDSRNYHIHINLSERPAKRMKDPRTGEMVWDFEITETTTDKHWNKRTRRPFMQTRNRAMSSRTWIKDERHRFCQTMNEILEKSGASKRYDARSYKDMGIDQQAKTRISPGSYTKERRGEPTPEGVQAAKKEWREEASRLVLKQERSLLAAIHQANIHQRLINHMYEAGFEGTMRSQTHANKWKEAAAHHRAAIGQRDAARFTAEKMVSRVRLVPVLNRTPLDKILINVSNSIRKDEEAAFAKEIEQASIEMKSLAENLRNEMQAFKRHLILARYQETIQRAAALHLQRNRQNRHVGPVDTTKLPEPLPRSVQPEQGHDFSPAAPGQPTLATDGPAVSFEPRAAHQSPAAPSTRKEKTANQPVTQRKEKRENKAANSPGTTPRQMAFDLDTPAVKPSAPSASTTAPSSLSPPPSVAGPPDKEPDAVAPDPDAIKREQKKRRRRALIASQKGRGR